MTKQTYIKIFIKCIACLLIAGFVILKGDILLADDKLNEKVDMLVKGLSIVDPNFLPVYCKFRDKSWKKYVYPEEYSSKNAEIRKNEKGIYEVLIRVCDGHGGHYCSGYSRSDLTRIMQAAFIYGFNWLKNVNNFGWWGDPAPGSEAHQYYDLGLKGEIDKLIIEGYETEIQGEKYDDYGNLVTPASERARLRRTITILKADTEKLNWGYINKISDEAFWKMIKWEGEKKSGDWFINGVYQED